MAASGWRILAGYSAPFVKAITMTLTPFHLALRVRDIAEARSFYGELLGCPEGRSDTHWVDFDLFGHQLVTHLDPSLGPAGSVASHANPVDGEQVPASHFGVILAWEDFDRLLVRLESREIAFVIPPTTRFAGRRGEQRTLFVRDPAGNHLEFKTFRNPDMLFATDGLDYP